jgi:hypothetical protein
MLLTAVHIDVPIGISLGVVAIVLAASILLSLLWPKKVESAVE